MSKKIVIQYDEKEFGIKLLLDGKIITRHLEVEIERALTRLLVGFGIDEEKFEIKDER